MKNGLAHCMQSIRSSCRPARLFAAALAIGLANSASASLVSIDFDSAATGSNLIASPLVTAEGTITLTAGGTLSYVSTIAGQGLHHAQRSGNDADRALLSFGFDVSSVTFSYAGNNVGAFLAEVIDINGNVLDSFADPATTCNSVTCFDGTVTLTGSDIRGFRFADAPSGFSFAVVDQLVLKTATVPEPISLSLTALGIGLLAATRRRRQR